MKPQVKKRPWLGRFFFIFSAVLFCTGILGSFSSSSYLVRIQDRPPDCSGMAVLGDKIFCALRRSSAILDFKEEKLIHVRAWPSTIIADAKRGVLICFTYLDNQITVLDPSGDLKFNLIMPSSNSVMALIPRQDGWVIIGSTTNYKKRQAPRFPFFMPTNAGFSVSVWNYFPSSTHERERFWKPPLLQYQETWYSESLSSWWMGEDANGNIAVLNTMGESLRILDKNIGKSLAVAKTDPKPCMLRYDKVGGWWVLSAFTGFCRHYDENLKLTGSVFFGRGASDFLVSSQGFLILDEKTSSICLIDIEGKRLTSTQLPTIGVSLAEWNGLVLAALTDGNVMAFELPSLKKVNFSVLKIGGRHL